MYDREAANYINGAESHNAPRPNQGRRSTVYFFIQAGQGEKMRKEYSDLPADQKMTYIKRNALVFTFTFIPFLIIFGVFVITLYSYSETVAQLPPMDSLNATQKIDREHQDAFVDFTTVVIVWFLVATIFGLTKLGFATGEWIANRLNLYTDLELEDAQRKADHIKKQLEKK